MQCRGHGNIVALSDIGLRDEIILFYNSVRTLYMGDLFPRKCGVLLLHVAMYPVRDQVYKKGLLTFQLTHFHREC